MQSLKTSSIATRVADFLKQHPPFEFLDREGLHDLASAGKMTFHEGDEIIFQQGDTRGGYLQVVQQGTVRMYKEGREGSEELIDLRGPGDLLGISWLLGEPNYIQTARTEGEAILYSLPWDDFLTLLQDNEEATRYLTAYFSTNPVYKRVESEQSEARAVPAVIEKAEGWLNAHTQVSQRAHMRLVTGPGTLEIARAAERIAGGLQEALIVVDANGCPLGIVTETDLVRKVATGLTQPGAPVSAIMSGPVMTVSDNLPVGKLMMLMMQHNLRHLVVTEDGTRFTRAIGLVAEKDVQMLHGRLPLGLVKEIRNSTQPGELGFLRQRAEQLMLSYLEERANLRWLAGYVAEIDTSLLRRSLFLAEEELRAEGLVPPDLAYCWVALGMEGRRERFLRQELRTAIIYEDPRAGEEARAEAWFKRLGLEVCRKLNEAGFPSSEGAFTAGEAEGCRSVSCWQTAYAEWIRDPLGACLLQRVPFFDLRGVAGDLRLVDQIRSTILTTSRAFPEFLALMANDALASLPPITIFRNGVLDRTGVLWTCVDTRSHALQPLSSLARVFALSKGAVHLTSTIERYLFCSNAWPEHKRLFESAAEACRIALFYQTLSGLRNGDNGQFIRVDQLPKVDQETLKSVFRTVVDLMAHTRRHFDLEEVTHLPQVNGEGGAEPAARPA
ncbi:MAG: DUF294 nucleotidyltransferase-like domain-containing protein [Opitutales bacterium]